MALVPQIVGKIGAHLPLPLLHTRWRVGATAQQIRYVDAAFH